MCWSRSTCSWWRNRPLVGKAEPCVKARSKTRDGIRLVNDSSGSVVLELSRGTYALAWLSHTRNIGCRGKHREIQELSVVSGVFSPALGDLAMARGRLVARQFEKIPGGIEPGAKPVQQATAVLRCRCAAARTGRLRIMGRRSGQPNAASAVTFRGSAWTATPSSR